MGGGGGARDGGLFNLEKTMVSVPHKKPRIQSGNAQVQEVGGHAAEDQKQIQSTRSFTVVIDSYSPPFISEEYLGEGGEGEGGLIETEAL